MSKDKIPRWYLRGKDFLNFYSQISETFEEAGDFEACSITVKRELFSKFKVAFILFYKTFKDILKLEDIIMHYPTEVLAEAQKRGWINTKDKWLEFIHYRRVLSIILREKDTKNENLILTEILQKFYPLLKQDISAINKLFEIHPEKYKLDLILPDNNEPIEYCPESINMSLKNYAHLLRIFMSIKDIKRVWLTGSQLHKTNPGADYDFVFEAKKESKIIIRAGLNSMRILNRFDIHTTDEVDHINTCRLIYRSKDFE